MNITAFEYEDSIIVVDCGLAFPGDDMLGIDLVIPDVSYLKQNIDKVKGFVITHGHEDHIGALPYILQQVNVPIYGTKLTIALIELNTTTSPGTMDTFLWMLAAIRDRAAMDSPWLPFVISTVDSGG